MNDNEKTISDFIHPLKNIVLSDTKANEMRAQLSAYADLHAVSPMQVASEARTGFRTFSFSYSRSWAVAAAVVVLLTGGTGVTFAAQDALPGDPLYAVKVSVAEPIQGAFVTGTQSKAEWENTLADRRLAEASTLAAENKLTPGTSVYLEQQITTDVADSDTDAAILQASGNTTGALAVRSDLDARLSAHEDVLSLITPRLAVAGDATTTVALADLLQQVDTVHAKVAEARVATELALTSEASSSPDTAPSTSAISPDASSTILAYVDAQNVARKQEETTMFTAEAKLLGLPAATSTPADATSTAESDNQLTATSTASTTPADTSASDDSSAATASSTPAAVFHPFHDHLPVVPPKISVPSVPAAPSL